MRNTPYSRKGVKSGQRSLASADMVHKHAPVPPLFPKPSCRFRIELMKKPNEPKADELSRVTKSDTWKKNKIALKVPAAVASSDLFRHCQIMNRSSTAKEPRISSVLSALPQFDSSAMTIGQGQTDVE